jgi:hypothetical protein
VHSYFEADDGDIVAIDGSVLVRWAADGAVRGKVDLAGYGYPAHVLPASDGLALVQFETELVAVVDMQSMRVLGPISFGRAFGCENYSMMTGGGPDLFATSFRYGPHRRERTTIVFWTLV